MATIIPRTALNKIVGAMVAEDSTLTAAAELVKANALMLAASHSKTGVYAGKIVLKKRVYKGIPEIDVIATDKAAAHIEFGHVLSGDPSKGMLPGEASTGKAKLNARGQKWVQGLHIMREACLMAGGLVNENVLSLSARNKYGLWPN